jgi:hypothetical protein
MKMDRIFTNNIQINQGDLVFEIHLQQGLEFKLDKEVWSQRFTCNKGSKQNFAMKSDLVGLPATGLLS